MVKHFKLLPPAASDYFTYAISFALIFDFGFLPQIQDGSETMGMFLLFSVFIALGLLAFSFLFYYFVRSKLKHIVAYCLIMYLLSELIAAFALGRLCLFGLFIGPVVYNGTPYPEIHIFQKHVAFGLSMSFIIAAAICFAGKALASYLTNAGPPKAG